VRHRLLPYSPGYFTATLQEGERPLPPSLNRHALEICRSLQEHAAGPVAEAPFFAGSAPNAAKAAGQEGTVRITLDELVAFWRDPARAWLEAQGIILGQEEADDTQLDRDPLKLDSLQEWGVRNSILRDRLEARLPAEHTQARLAGDRALPLAELGTGLWNRLYPRTAQMAETVRQLRCDTPLNVNLQIRLGAQDVELGGSVELAGQGGARQLLLYRIGGYGKASHAIEAWVRTVVAACAAGEALGCILLDDSLQSGQPPLVRGGIDPEAARQHLIHLVSGLLEGRKAPLCFAPATSAAYAKARAPEPHQELLLEAADGAWYQESDYARGEGLSRHAQLAWRGLDPFAPERLAWWHAWATQISAEVLTWEAAP
jgi:exodeoxyribonuclease V gamma subunit